jgi:hypothetical protein
VIKYSGKLHLINSDIFTAMLTEKKKTPTEAAKKKLALYINKSEGLYVLYDAGYLKKLDVDFKSDKKSHKKRGF